MLCYNLTKLEPNIQNFLFNKIKVDIGTSSNSEVLSSPPFTLCAKSFKYIYLTAFLSLSTLNISMNFTSFSIVNT